MPNRHKAQSLFSKFRQKVEKAALYGMAAAGSPAFFALLLKLIAEIKDDQVRASLGESILASCVSALSSESGGQQACPCEDCKFYGYGYMLHQKVWLSALSDQELDLLDRGEKKSMMLCPCCVEKRMGRPLRIEDFDPTYSINWPIMCAFKIGRDGKGDLSELHAQYKERYVAEGHTPDDAAHGR